MKKHLLELSDDALIEGYRAGDTQCFDVLLERYSSCILYWIRQKTNNEDEVADLYQEISLRISQKLKNVYEGRGYFPAWAHCVVGNYLYSTYRKKRPDTVELSPNLLNHNKLAAEESVPSHSEECFRILEAVVKEQSEPMQRLIRMRYWEDCTYQEISNRTGINMSTVIKRLRTGCEKMKRLMKGRGIDMDS